MRVMSGNKRIAIIFIALLLLIVALPMSAQAKKAPKKSKHATQRVVLTERHTRVLNKKGMGNPKSYRWSSSNTAVVRAYLPGEVQGLKPGTAIVTARRGFKKIRFRVEVKRYDVREQLNKLDLSRVNRLMIVAHPDDDTIWGGGSLIQGNYLVVNVTAGVSPHREQEFRRAMRRTGDTPLALAYPDFKNNNFKKRIPYRWSTATEAQISRDLATIMSYKPWAEIITHSPDGESGHFAHRKVSKLVTRVYRQQKATSLGLTYFGHIYPRWSFGLQGKEIPVLRKMNGHITHTKRSVLREYKSQQKVTHFWRYFDGYESKIDASVWRHSPYSTRAMLHSTYPIPATTPDSSVVID